MARSIFSTQAPKPEDFGDLLYPAEAIEPILSRAVRGAVTEWLTEVFATDELEAVGLKPRKRALFDGPPGVGKSTLAHHVLARLGLPMLVVRPERLIGSWVGSTGRNIGALFDCVADAGEPVALMFDEFDAVASKRRTNTQQGAEDERNNYVNTLLQRIEQHDGFLVAATNFGVNIDPAIWRRFDIHLKVELPGQFEIERILARYLAPYGLPKTPLRGLAEALATATPSLIRQFCEGIKRQLVLGPKVGWDMRRDAAIERLLAAIEPHPDTGKPRLWSQKAADSAVRILPWPLPMIADIPADEVVPALAEPQVVAFPGRRP